MKIRMYDVDFGESILYRDSDDSLLVDCGTLSGASLPYNRVKNDIQSGQTDLLLSHFDRDHYNGIIELSKNSAFLFRKIYLTMFTYKDGNLEYTWDVLEDALLTVALLTAVGWNNRVSLLYEFMSRLPLLVNHMCSIKCVCDGDTIRVGSRVFEVVWPPREPKFPFEFEPLAESLRNEIRSYTNSSNFEEFEYAASNFVRIFVKTCHLISSGDATNETMEELQVAYDTLTGNASGLNINDSDINKAKIREFFAKLMKNMNECSVVFKDGKDILALGDVSPQIIEHLLDKGKIGMLYRVVKVQHHGTEKYWTPRLPDAECYLISNNGEIYKHFSISKEYELNYPSRVHCTNAIRSRCDFLKQSKTLMCWRCTNPNPRSCVDVDMSTTPLSITF